MVTIISAAAESFTRDYIAWVLKIDLIIFLILIGLLTFMEFLVSYDNQRNFLRPESRLRMVKILYLAIAPFLYVFCYVLIYRVMNMA